MNIKIDSTGKGKEENPIDKNIQIESESLLWTNSDWYIWEAEHPPLIVIDEKGNEFTTPGSYNVDKIKAVWCSGSYFEIKNLQNWPKEEIKEVYQLKAKEKEETETSIAAEYILCSAIWFNDGKIHEGQPKNINIGFIVSGRRHHNCYAVLTAIADSLGIEGRIRLLLDKNDRDKQGFLTNLNRYVDRKEGWQIAIKANQVINGKDLVGGDNPILISENLY